MPHLLKEIVSMCGVFKPHLAGTFLTEWNAMLEPHATAIVYHSPVKMH
jgi:purine nucleosidase